MLKLTDVTFRYGHRPILRSIDFSLDAGEMVAVLGPNGSGKTTFLRLACGTLRPSAGRVELEGRDLGRIPLAERARSVAVVAQSNRLAFDFTVEQVVMMGRTPHLGLLGLPGEADRQRAGWAMVQTAVDGLAGRSFHALSGGEQQRVVLARALAQEPRLLLLDEPTTGLDLKHRLVTYELLRELNRSCGLTVLLMSHDINMAARYVDRLVLLDRGRIHADGSPESVLTPDNLRQVYEVVADVRPGDGGDGPQVVARRPID